jgi:hypothetical protein
LVAAVEMGLGHLRAADALARGLGVPVAYADRTPLAFPEELRLWSRSRGFYERVSRATQLPAIGAPFRALLEVITHIPPLHPHRDLSRPVLATRTVERLIARGLGAGLMAELGRSRAPLLATHFIPTLVADAKGYDDAACLITDTDLARAWVPRDPARSRIRYFAPTPRAAQRLAAYGVAPGRIEQTGFPLPHELVGGEDAPILRRNLGARLARLDRGGQFRRTLGGAVGEALGETAARAEDDRPPLLVFAVGGAGAQAELAAAFLPSLKPAILRGELRLALVAGVKPIVAARFRRVLRKHRLEGHAGVTVLLETDVERYFRAFNALLADADVIWTKPSEMTFFAALGLPLILSPAVGAQERYNQRWAIENGAAVAQRDPRCAGDWLEEWRRDSVLAATAWNGFTLLPRQGLYRICAAFGREVADGPADGSRAAPSTGSRATLSSV